MILHQPTFRWFQCTTDDNLDKSFTCQGNYIQQGEPNFHNIITNAQNSDDEDEVSFTFFGRSYDDSIWFSDSAFHMLCLLARKNKIQLEQTAIQASTSFSSTDYSLVRRRVCELVLASRDVITSPSNEYQDLKVYMNPSVKILFQNMKRLKDLPDYVIFNSTKKNENINQLASYNYLHLVLDMYWLTLTTEHYIEEELSLKLEVFESNINTILSDLIHVSVKKFEKINSFINLSKQSPFMCSCFKELWLLIQLYIEQLHIQQFCKDFWHYFNSAIKNEMNLQNCTNGKDAVKCLWLLYHIARIEGYSSDGSYIGPQHFRVVSNFSLVEQCLRIGTNINLVQIDEQQMCSCLHLLASLQMTWWKKDSSFDLLQLLWEYFYKKLNESFLNEPGTFLTNLQKSYDYSSLTQAILEYDLEQSPGIVSSYDVFLCLLGKYLIMKPTHWPKLKGRIYSKLSPPKLKELTDNGLHNLIQLFFVLAYTVDFKELTDKLQSLLSQLPLSRSEGNNVIWSAYISLLIMKTNRGISLNGIGGTEVCTPILSAVQSACCDRSQDHLMKIYIEGLKKIIDYDKDLRCRQYALFGGWINRYLLWCSHSDACLLLDILINIVEKVENLGGQSEWWDVFETNVVSSITHLSSSIDAPSQIAKLSAKLIFADQKRFKNLLDHITGDTVNMSLSVKFLTSILENNRCSDLSSEHQALLIQAWIRIAVLNTNKSELAELTSLMIWLPSWSSLNCSFNEDEDPLYAVIRSAGIRMRDSKSVQDTALLKKWFETYFGRMDKWVGPVVSETEKGENAQLVMRVYTTAAVLYLHCAPVLYMKNKNTCIFHRLTSTLLLPTSILMNKRPSNIILAALKRTWHLFIRGIARLDYKSDTYIERTLRDMTIRYVPFLNDASSPLIRCLDNEFEDNASAFIIDKIANNIISCKSKNTHEHSLPALKLVLEMSRKQCENFTKVEIFMNTIFPTLCEQVMFSEDATAKNFVNEIIVTVKSNQYYDRIREIFKSCIINIFDKHLPFYSSNVFRFLEQIVNVLSPEIDDVFSDLTNAVKKVECMRGVGYDNTLRKGLQRISEQINNPCS